MIFSHIDVSSSTLRSGLRLVSALALVAGGLAAGSVQVGCGGGTSSPGNAGDDGGSGTATSGSLSGSGATSGDTGGAGNSTSGTTTSGSASGDMGGSGNSSSGT